MFINVSKYIMKHLLIDPLFSCSDEKKLKFIFLLRPIKIKDHNPGKSILDNNPYVRSCAVPEIVHGFSNHKMKQSQAVGMITQCNHVRSR